jgi:malate synthase
VDVVGLHKKNIKKRCVTIDDLIDLPIINNPNWTEDEINNELENNIQGILGYVVKWVNNGIGCSKVLDINNIGLMEDRATLRISSQHIANWLYHGICDKSQVLKIFKKMAVIVDKQNEHDFDYIPMSKDLNKSIAFQTAVELVLMGKEQPSGYTEPILHNGRLKFKNNCK